MGPMQAYAIMNRSRSTSTPRSNQQNGSNNTVFVKKVKTEEETIREAEEKAIREAKNKEEEAIRQAEEEAIREAKKKEDILLEKRRPILNKAYSELENKLMNLGYKKLKDDNRFTEGDYYYFIDNEPDLNDSNKGVLKVVKKQCLTPTGLNGLKYNFKCLMKKTSESNAAKEEKYRYIWNAWIIKKTTSVKNFFGRKESESVDGLSVAYDYSSVVAGGKKCKKSRKCRKSRRNKSRRRKHRK